MVRYLITMSYLGTKYSGVARQPSLRYSETIQGVLEAGLKLLHPVSEPLLSLSSRTDKGVHALENTAHVDLTSRLSTVSYPPYLITETLNKYLQGNNHDIIITKTQAVPDEFSARQNALSRTYKYRIAVPKKNIHFNHLFQKNYFSLLPILELNRCHLIFHPFNPNKIYEAVSLLLGNHDFANFMGNPGNDVFIKSTVKTLDKFEFRPVEEAMCIMDKKYQHINMWEFTVKAKSFLYKQVRKMVGAVIDVAAGNLTLDDVSWMLENPKSQNCVPKIHIVSPCGLYLTHIEYDPKDLEVQTKQ